MRERSARIVVNVPTVKPLDKAVCSFAQETGRVVTVEEHQRIGGLGSAVAERLSEDCPMPVHRIGVDDVFGQSGTPEELLSHYGLSKEHIIEVAAGCRGIGRMADQIYRFFSLMFRLTDGARAVLVSIRCFIALTTPGSCSGNSGCICSGMLSGMDSVVFFWRSRFLF